MGWGRARALEFRIDVARVVHQSCSTARAVACDRSDASRTAAGVWRWRIQGILRDRIDKGEIATVVSGRRADRDQSRACAQRMDSGRAVSPQLVVTYDAWNLYCIDGDDIERV